jgi:hypothetical protein
MELGLYSFAENTPDPLNGDRLQSPADRLKDLLEEIELADQLGLAFYGLGEHHPPRFRGLGACDHSRCRRRAHQEYPPVDRGNGPELGRPGPRLPAIRHP